jgi:hypothetical protein
MRWVVLIIVVFIAGYTFVELRYRKSVRSHEPYAEARQRAALAHLHEAGWEKMPLAIRRPAEKPPAGPNATVSHGALGLGLDLAGAFTDRPVLLASIDEVAAPATVPHGADYTASFIGSVPDQQLQVGGMQLYRRGQDLVLVPDLEKLPSGGVLSRWRDANYAFTFPTDGLAAGAYQVRVIAGGPAAVWTFVVK